MPRTIYFSCTGIRPFYPNQAKRIGVQIGPSLTLSQGTILGQMNGRNDIQRLTISGNPSGGTFTLSLTFGGFTETTTPIPASPTAAQIRTALATMGFVSSITNVTVVGGTGSSSSSSSSSSTAGNVFTITFVGNLANTPMPLLTSDATGLTGGSNPAVTLLHVQTGISAESYGAYNSWNTDGSQVAKGILEFDCATDALGNISLGDQTGGSGNWTGEYFSEVPMFVKGAFNTKHLIGLDATAVSQLGRLVAGGLTGPNWGTFEMA